MQASQVIEISVMIESKYDETWKQRRRLKVKRGEGNVPENVDGGEQV